MMTNTEKLYLLKQSAKTPTVPGTVGEAQRTLGGLGVPVPQQALPSMIANEGLGKYVNKGRDLIGLDSDNVGRIKDQISRRIRDPLQDRLDSNGMLGRLQDSSIGNYLNFGKGLADPSLSLMPESDVWKANLGNYKNPTADLGYKGKNFNADANINAKTPGGHMAYRSENFNADASMDGKTPDASMSMPSGRLAGSNLSYTDGAPAARLGLSQGPFAGSNLEYEGGTPSADVNYKIPGTPMDLRAGVDDGEAGANFSYGTPTNNLKAYAGSQGNLGFDYKHNIKNNTSGDLQTTAGYDVNDGGDVGLAYNPSNAKVPSLNLGVSGLGQDYTANLGARIGGDEGWSAGVDLSKALGRQADLGANVGYRHKF